MRCILFSIKQSTQKYIIGKGFIWNDVSQFIFNARVTVYCKYGYEMRNEAWKLQPCKNDESQWKQTQKSKTWSILKSIFSNRTRCGRLLKETAVYTLFTATFLVNKVASTSVLITTNKQKITQFHRWVNSFSIVLKSKLSSLIAQVKVKLIRKN